MEVVMTREELCAKRYEALEAFGHIGNPTYCAPYGNGHINDTFLVICEGKKRYILQRINHSIFTNPQEIMENICAVTDFIRKKSAEIGADTERCTLSVVKTLSGESFYQDSIGSYWRLYDFTERTVTKEKVSNIKEFYDCAEAFGKFQAQLAEFDASSLHEAIKDFHNTPMRFANLLRAIENNPLGRVAEVGPEIKFALEREEFTKTLEKAHAEGRLPLRVTHNDTKLNNILFDEHTGSPVCVIDLDTVMPGYSVNDFGDSIRFGANTAAEDETNLSKVSLDLELYRAYTEGFLRGCDGRLTSSEIELLPIGAIMMTLECGLRFLTDYIEGDVYFRISRPSHNLDRCRTQFALVADMEKNLDSMQIGNYKV